LICTILNFQVSDVAPVHLVFNILLEVHFAVDPTISQHNFLSELVDNYNKCFAAFTSVSCSTLRNDADIPYFSP
jgi:hypothetical protein